MDSGAAGLRCRRGSPPADLGSALEASGIAVFDLSFATQEIWISPGVEQLLGEVPEQLTPQYHQQLMHPEDARRLVEQPIAARVQHADTCEFEVRVRQAPDAWRWIRVRGRVIARGPDGSARRLVGTVSDATASKTIEQNLQERLELEALVVRISTAFLSQRIDEVDIGIERALQTVGEFTGIDRAYVFQLDAADVVATNTHEWCVSGITAQREGLQAVALDRELPEFARRIRRREDVLVEDLTALPAATEREQQHFLAQGIQSLICVPMVCRDRLLGFVGLDAVRSRRRWAPEVVTLLKMVADIFANALDRRQRQQCLLESEERYRQLAEMLPEIVFETVADGRVTFVNQLGLAKTGYAREDLERGLYLQDLIAAEDRERGRQAIAALLSGSSAAVPHEYMGQAKDGRCAPILAYTSPILSGDRVVGLRGLVVDITERKRAEEERRRLEQQLQQAQKLESLGVLASGIAHDLNNLLTGVLGNASLALVDLAADAPARSSIEQIEAVALQAAGLAQQMLAYSGQGRVVTEVMLLPAVIQEMRYLLGASVSKRCEVSYHFAPGIPPIEGDLSQVRQVIMNLVINASEAIGEAGGAITVRVRPVRCDREYLLGCQYGNERSPGDYVALEVVDTGCGITPEVLAKIFDPFFSTKFVGRGLGLAAVRGIVHGHAGAIRVISVAGQGTAIEVLFPASGEQPTSRPPERRAAGVPRYRGMVLLVDDEEVVVAVARQMLERLGFEVLTALDGQKGTELFSYHAEEFRLVLLDRTMPRMDGIETLAQLRRIRGEVPVIMASGFTQEDAASWSENVRPDAFLSKPYSLESLMDTVARVLGDGY